VQVSEELKRHYGAKVFDTVIPRNVRIAEAPSIRQARPAARSRLQGARWRIFNSHASCSERSGVKVAEAA
jgi:cellulose biosynthesis protein BcsQ